MTRAAARDASFYRRPDVRGVKVYHVVAAPGISACGRMLYDQQEAHDRCADSIDAADAPTGLRCQRPGCKSRWPDAMTPSAPPMPSDRLSKEKNVSSRSVIAGAIDMISRQDLSHWSDDHDKVTLAALREFRSQWRDRDPEQQWKLGNEFLPFHPQASHVPPDYRDGWNRCYWMAVARDPHRAPTHPESQPK